MAVWNLSENSSALYQFHAQKALFKVPKICNINFWIENDPLPLELFRKFIQFGAAILPLVTRVANDRTRV